MKIIICLIVVVIVQLVHGIEHHPIRNGRWSDSSIWNNGVIPQQGDDIRIEDGFSVIFDAISTPRLRWIVIEEGGELIFLDDNNSDAVPLHLTVESIIVYGYLEIGKENDLFQRNAKITLININPPPPRGSVTSRQLFQEPYGSKMLGVAGHGRWEAHAQGRNPTWTHINAHINPGSTTVLVDEPVDWKIGDEIIVSTTDYNPDQTERRRITAISNDRLQLIVDTPFAYGHFGERSELYGGIVADMRAEVAVLTSNVLIEGDMEISPPHVEPEESLFTATHLQEFMQYGCHTIGVAQSIMRIEGIEFAFCGQGGILARYPVHWHHRKDAPGQYIKRSLIHDSFSRTITVHDTNMLLVEGNVCYDTYGHSIYLEDGVETLNQFYYNLVVTARPVGNENDNADLSEGTTGSWRYPLCTPGLGNNEPGIRLQFLDWQPSGFWITNVNNTFVGNVAAGMNWGFWIRVQSVFNEPSYIHTGCAHQTCACASDDPNDPHRINLNKYGNGLIFVDNVAHSCPEGGWWIKENWVPSDYTLNTIDGFLAYKNNVGVENYGSSNIIFKRQVVVDNGLGLFNDHNRVGYPSRTRPDRRYDNHSKFIFQDCLFVGETNNFGNQNSGRQDWRSDSRVFPGHSRSVFGKHYRGLYSFTDTSNDLINVHFSNALPMNDDQVTSNIGTYIENTFFGALLYPQKSLFNAPDNLIKGVTFDNIVLGQVWGSGPDFTVIPFDRAYGFGMFDEDGSLPCSSPGTYFFGNMPGLASPLCSYRPELNMFQCSPEALNNKGIRLLAVRHHRHWAPTELPGLRLRSECDRIILGKTEEMLFPVRTDKQMEIIWDNHDTVVPRGFVFRPRRPSKFEGIFITIRVPGRARITHLFRDYPNTPPHIDYWTEDNSVLEQQCTCNGQYTYARVEILGTIDHDSQEIRIDIDNSISCTSSCHNPYPQPVPVGYTCSDPIPQGCRNAQVHSTYYEMPPRSSAEPIFEWPVSSHPEIIQYSIPNDPNIDTNIPSESPTPLPTITNFPSHAPTGIPTFGPLEKTAPPSQATTKFPTSSPHIPTTFPTNSPHVLTNFPSAIPTTFPTVPKHVTSFPSSVSTPFPTRRPSTLRPTFEHFRS